MVLLLRPSPGVSSIIPRFKQVALDPVLNRSGDTWHIALPNLDASLLYGEADTTPRQ